MSQEEENKPCEHLSQESIYFCGDCKQILCNECFRSHLLSKNKICLLIPMKEFDTSKTINTLIKEAQTTLEKKRLEIDRVLEQLKNTSSPEEIYKSLELISKPSSIVPSPTSTPYKTPIRKRGVLRSASKSTFGGGASVQDPLEFKEPISPTTISPTPTKPKENESKPEQLFTPVTKIQKEVQTMTIETNSTQKNETQTMSQTPPKESSQTPPNEVTSQIPPNVIQSEGNQTPKDDQEVKISKKKEKPKKRESIPRKSKKKTFSFVERELVDFEEPVILPIFGMNSNKKRKELKAKDLLRNITKNLPLETLNIFGNFKKNEFEPSKFISLLKKKETSNIMARTQDLNELKEHTVEMIWVYFKEKINKYISPNEIINDQQAEDLIKVHDIKDLFYEIFKDFKKDDIIRMLGITQIGDKTKEMMIKTFCEQFE